MRVAITHAAALSGMIDEAPLANPRARKMMSRAAYLAARCMAQLVRETGWRDPETIGCYLGVGGSGGSLDDVAALLEASIVDGEFSLARFGDRGLAACNPLLAFQLMNNFTMCHAAILEGLRGPNAALFSRGAGTIAALAEAEYAVRSGECARAITGGADTPTHPVTRAELEREGAIARGLVPMDAVGLLALEVAKPGDVVMEHAVHASGRDRAIDEAFAPLLPECTDVVVIAPWGPPAREELRAVVRERFADAALVELGPGESLAASAALAVIAARDALRERTGRAVVLTLGIDGDPGCVVLSRGVA